MAGKGSWAALLITILNIMSVHTYNVFSPIYIRPSERDVLETHKPCAINTLCATLCEFEDCAAYHFNQVEKTCLLLNMPIEYSHTATDEYTERVLKKIVPGVPSPWEPWGSCSESCGTGTLTRTRFCINPHPQHRGGQKCSEGLTESVNCDLDPCPVCLPGWHELPDSTRCVKKNMEELSFEAALETCEAWAEDGSLVSIHSQAQNDFLRDSFAVGESVGVWIGLHDKDTEDHFQWTDGTDTNYMNFHSTEPNGGTEENCGHFFKLCNLLWNDLRCDYQMPSICQTGHINN